MEVVLALTTFRYILHFVPLISFMNGIRGTMPYDTSLSNVT